MHTPLISSRMRQGSTFGVAAALTIGFSPLVHAQNLELTAQSDLDAWWEGTEDLWLGETGYRANGQILQQGLCEARFEEGILVPVYSGKGPVEERIIGLVFMGEGELEVDFASQADAWRFANHRVLGMGEPREKWQGLANLEEDYRVGFDRTLILTADPAVRDLLVDLEPVRSGVILREGTGEVDEEYVITEGRGDRTVRAVGTNMLPQRRRQLQKAGIEIESMLRQDRLRIDVLGMPSAHARMLADFRTVESQGVVEVSNQTLAQDDHDRWLSCFRDTTDQLESGFHSMVFSVGTSADGRRHFERFSGEVVEGPVEFPQLVPVSASVHVEAVPKARHMLRAVDVDSTIQLRAEGGEVRSVGLSFPVSGNIKSWQVDSLRLSDGRELAWVPIEEGVVTNNSRLEERRVEEWRSTGFDHEAELVDKTLGAETSSGSDRTVKSSLQSSRKMGKTPPGEGTIHVDLDWALRTQSERRLVSETMEWKSVLAILPEPLAEGEALELELSWSQDWQFANWTSERRNLGSTTGPQVLLPELFPHAGDTAWDYEVEMGMPNKGMRRTSAALSGTTEEEWVDGSGWVWVRSRGDQVIQPVLSMGQWHSGVSAKYWDSPAVRINLFRESAHEVGKVVPEVRRVVKWLNEFLPDYPLAEVDVVQSSSLLLYEVREQGVRQAHPGVVEIRRVVPPSAGSTRTLEDSNPHWMRVSVARQLAYQYWGQQIVPATGRDVWLGSALSDAYASFYLHGAVGPEAMDAQMQALRAGVESPNEKSQIAGQASRTGRPISLTGATGFSDLSPEQVANYGAYVVGDMIRLRIGDYSYFGALDRLAERIASVPSSRISTDDLQAAFEESSNQDLGDFFDYWVHGGFVPEVSLSIRHVENSVGVLHGCIETNIPFGRMDIPVEIVDQDGARTVAAMIDVVDGRGSFWIANRDDNVQVKLDPRGMILAYQREVEWVTEQACDLRPKNARSE